MDLLSRRLNIDRGSTDHLKKGRVGYSQANTLATSETSLSSRSNVVVFMVPHIPHTDITEFIDLE